MKKGGQQWPPFFVPAMFSQLMKIPCGSELARDGGITSNIDVCCYTAIASKLAPTGLCADYHNWVQIGWMWDNARHFQPYPNRPHP